MTEPVKQDCEHLATVVVNAPHQCVYDGVVYTAGDTVESVATEVADEWVAHGWASPPTTEQTPTKTTAKRTTRK
jgi:hypothetical protein